jgi:hypothetical protein
MQHVIALVAAALGLAVPIGGSPVTATACGNDVLLRAAVERRDVPGVVAMATDRRGVIYSGAAGVASFSPSRPTTADAVFRIASMTKAVTSVDIRTAVLRRAVEDVCVASALARGDYLGGAPVTDGHGFLQVSLSKVPRPQHRAHARDQSGAALLQDAESIPPPAVRRIALGTPDNSPADGIM